MTWPRVASIGCGVRKKEQSKVTQRLLARAFYVTQKKQQEEQFGRGDEGKLARPIMTCSV